MLIRIWILILSLYQYLNNATDFFIIFLVMIKRLCTVHWLYNWLKKMHTWVKPYDALASHLLIWFDFNQDWSPGKKLLKIWMLPCNHNTLLKGNKQKFFMKCFPRVMTVWYALFLYVGLESSFCSMLLAVSCVITMHVLNLQI